jgi:hypothetical protein
MDDVTFFGSWPWQTQTQIQTDTSSVTQEEENQGQECGRSLKLNDFYTQRVLKYARKRLDKSQVEKYYQQTVDAHFSLEDSSSSSSSLPSTCTSILQTSHSDLTLEHMLGQGSFSSVYGVRRLNRHRHVLKEEKVVVKILREKLLEKPAMLAACVADLIKEGLLLAACSQDESQHPGKRHILQVHGWTPTLLHGFANGRHDSFFLVLEKLDYTLSHKLEFWRRRFVDVSPAMILENAKKQKQRLLGKPFPKFWKKKKNLETDPTASQSNIADHEHISLHMQQLEFWQLRLQLVIDLANAVEYLHSKRILHRDLKRK